MKRIYLDLIQRGYGTTLFFSVLFLLILPIALLPTKAAPKGYVTSEMTSADGMTYRVFYRSDSPGIAVVNVTLDREALDYYRKQRNK